MYRIATLVMMTSLSVVALAQEISVQRPVPGSLLAEALADPGLRGHHIVFSARPYHNAGHAYETFGHFSQHDDRPTGYIGWSQLRTLDLRTGEQAVILEDTQGVIRDPQVHYDGRTIVFSYRRGNEAEFHIYEIQSDGSGLRQITRGSRFDDVQPTYLPNDDIVFVSSRAQRYVPCFVTQVGNLFRVDRQGQTLRRLTVHVDQDMVPFTLPDGRIGFTRWDYIDRHEQGTFGMWAINPDGSKLSALKIDNFIGEGWIDARVINQQTLVAVFTNKNVANHFGQPVIIDLTVGPDAAPSVSARDRGRNPKDYLGVTPLGVPWGKEVERAARLDRDPYPLSDRWFLICSHEGLNLFDRTTGRSELILDASQFGRPGRVNKGSNQPVRIHEPQLLQPREREPLIPDLPLAVDETGTPVASSQMTGRIMMQDFHLGRPHSLGDIKRGEVASILVVESLPAPIRHTDEPKQLGFGSVWNIKRLIGTFPVEADGSAFAELPANRSLQLIALDAEGRGLRRMSSGFTLMPGETLGCIGCHDYRNDATPPAGRTLAMQRPPTKVQVDPGIPDIIDYNRDIQPLWDRHCLECHNPDRPEGRISLSGDRNPGYTESITHLVGLRHIALVAARGPFQIPVREAGALASPVMRMIDGSHHGATLSAQERLLLLRWIETGGNFASTYAADGTGETVVRVSDQDLQSCFDCHQSVLYKETKFRRERQRDSLISNARMRAMRQSRRLRDPVADLLLFNLSRPDRSLILKAPLATKAGGYGWCKDAEGHPIAVFTDTTDPQYRAILAAIQEASTRLNAYERPGFVPSPNYIREMIRYGVLPEDYDPATDPFDPDDIDRRYFEQQYRQVVPMAESSDE